MDDEQKKEKYEALKAAILKKDEEIAAMASSLRRMRKKVEEFSVEGDMAQLENLEKEFNQI